MSRLYISLRMRTKREYGACALNVLLDETPDKYYYFEHHVTFADINRQTET